MALVEIKDLNALIDSKPFYDQPIKNLLKCQENILDYSWPQNYYKLIGIDLSR